MSKYAKTKRSPVTHILVGVLREFHQGLSGLRVIPKGDECASYSEPRFFRQPSNRTVTLALTGQFLAPGPRQNKYGAAGPHQQRRLVLTRPPPQLPRLVARESRWECGSLFTLLAPSDLPKGAKGWRF